MAERLFLALWPGTAQRLALAQVQGALPPRVGRPTHPEDIHLTLVFLGPASPEQRHCAEMAAGRVRGCPFELTLDRVGSFPRARVLWCGAAVAPPPLADLVLALRSELAGCGFALDDRPYRPHATLARKAPALEARTLDPPIRWPVVPSCSPVARKVRHPVTASCGAGLWTELAQSSLRRHDGANPLCDT